MYDITCKGRAKLQAGVLKFCLVNYLQEVKKF